MKKFSEALMNNGHECYIIAAGDFFGLRETPDDSDYVIAADAGYRYCRENGIIPDLILGDFDSLGEVPEMPNVIQLPVEKDDTDTVYAAKLGLEKGYRHFLVYGALGGNRSDHTIANMQLLLYLSNRSARGWLFGKDHVWTAVKNGSIKLSGKGAVSVFCIDGSAKGVSLKGLKYELSDSVISSDFPLGVSNSLDGGEAVISISDGCLLIMYDSDIGETE